MIGEIVTFGTLFAALFAGLYVSTLAFVVWGAVVFSEPISETAIPQEREGEAYAELLRRLETDGGDR
jgi:hypothetical protein